MSTEMTNPKSVSVDDLMRMVISYGRAVFCAGETKSIPSNDHERLVDISIQERSKLKTAIERVVEERDVLLVAAKRQPLKTNKLRAAISLNRDGSRSCNKHGMYAVNGQIPNEVCQVCGMEQERDAAVAEYRRISKTLETVMLERDALIESLRLARIEIAELQSYADWKR